MNYEDRVNYRQGVNPKGLVAASAPSFDTGNGG